MIQFEMAQAIHQRCSKQAKICQRRIILDLFHPKKIGQNEIS